LDIKHTSLKRVTIRHDWQVTMTDIEQFICKTVSNIIETVNNSNSNGQNSSAITKPNSILTPSNQINTTSYLTTPEPADLIAVAAAQNSGSSTVSGQYSQRITTTTSTTAKPANSSITIQCMIAIVIWLIYALTFDVNKPESTVVNVPVTVRAYALPHNGNTNDVSSVLKALQIAQQSGWIASSGMSFNNTALAVAQEHTKTHVRVGSNGESPAVLPSVLQNRTITRLSVDARGRRDERAIYRILLKNIAYLTQLESIDIVFHNRKYAATDILQAVYAHCPRIHSVAAACTC
jgi:hypothetical protein